MTAAALSPPSADQSAPAVNHIETFLTMIAQSIFDKMDDSLFSDFSVEASLEMAENIWTRWSRCTEAPQRRATLEAVATCSFDDFDAEIERVEKAFGTSANSDLGKLLGNYLNLVPGSIRRWCKRPSSPAGTTVPEKMPLASGEDLLPLLPARMTRFQPGDRPWAVGDWELLELIEHTAHREVWKAKNLSDEAAKPVALHFILHPQARAYALKTGTDLLQQIQKLGDMPGIVQLQAVHLHTEPPCLQYEFREAATVTSLVQEWRDSGQRPHPWQVADVIQQVARILGQLHRREPAIVSRHLGPGQILLTARTRGGWRCCLANLGLGPWSGAGELDKNTANPYASPEQLRDDPPRPQDDVFALGVLWYQLLTDNLNGTRPGGSSWRRRLIAQGSPPELVELLECCFDDDPSERPADGVVLCERIRALASRRQSSSFSGVRRISVAAVNSLGMAFAPVPAGTFFMGSEHTEPGRCPNEFLRHEVTMPAPVLIAVTPVTQRQFEEVMGTNPSHCTAALGGSPEHPVESVSWHEAVEYCRRLSESPREQRAGRTYRLPTETEWECACRAGTVTSYGFGAMLPPSHACFASQSPTRVGRFAPNAYGIFDMHGNVWEWCEDVSPGNPAGALRVLRGGSWRLSAAACRSASRHALPADSRADDVGFRVVMEMRNSQETKAPVPRTMMVSRDAESSEPSAASLTLDS
jgi:formylglycine-generating enzyme required for sulfatase activity